ncbi:MAG: hypothetical protein FD161_460 [Limisphaerales bacterium]|nr:MAG: hypothetical protein FD161_460 [Limisphaerales bacterium]KAG0510365.1 MAG: hypothetical protein E1N63_460 [Limisphaerales bacterium]TXT51552.1 MAG: hypothetical protein FD140_1590 [Limisphaerales bacterium]
MKLLFYFISLACLTLGVRAESLTLIPAKFTLDGPAAEQRLVLELADGKILLGQVTNSVAFTSSNPKVVRIEDGIAVAVGNGTATVTGKSGRSSAKAEVRVVNMDKPFAWNFRNHVQPVLAKTGCSMGACHGAFAGQGGFKLSLRGWDDEGDFRSITRSALGRRVTVAEPAHSLLLIKPTAAVPHKGGDRFGTNSLDYRILAEWVANGTPAPRPEDARITRLEVLPEQVFLKAGVPQQILVRATFSDGEVRDVTRWAKFTSANGSVCSIGEDGMVTAIGPGEGPISAWYLSRIAMATVTVPYQNKLAASTFTKAPRRNFIDELVNEKLKALNVPPSPRCSDSEFLRRAFLDTTGILPTAAEVREFLADASPKKRDALIERLLARPEFVDYWSYKWSDLLLVNGAKLPQPAMWSYYQWIRGQVEANTPWDEFVRQLVTARGSTLDNGAANYFVLHDDPTLMAETTTVAFMGLAINCAKCHNHPMEKWTNDQYYEFANLFARVRTKNGSGGEGDKVIFAAASGDVPALLSGKPLPPRPLDGQAIAIDAPGDRREALAAWLTSRDNPYFTRAIANRVWANFMGVGLVEAVDDLRVTNPASNEKLLSALAKFLADQRYDLKSLMRLILQSEAYQRGSESGPGNAGDQRYYSRYYPRRLMAEALLDAYSQVTGVPTEFRRDVRNANRGVGDRYPVSLRALQLPDANVASYFLKTFGRADRLQTCECERSEEPSMAQALHIANGDTLNPKLAAKDNRIGKLLAEKKTNEEILDEAFLSTLSRPPTATERTRSLKLLTDAGEAERRAALEDLYWGLLSSKEFLFNH